MTLRGASPRSGCVAAPAWRGSVPAPSAPEGGQVGSDRVGLCSSHATLRRQLRLTPRHPSLRPLAGCLPLRPAEPHSRDADPPTWHRGRWAWPAAPSGRYELRHSPRRRRKPDGQHVSSIRSRCSSTSNSGCPGIHFVDRFEWAEHLRTIDARDNAILHDHVEPGVTIALQASSSARTCAAL